jgi:phenylacetate-CoA ligase
MGAEPMLSPRSLSRRVLFPAYFAATGIEFRESLRLYGRTQWWSRDRLEELTRSRLRAVVAAASTMEFYAQRFRGCGLEAAAVGSIADLSDLPLLEKADLPSLLECVRGRGSRRATAGTSGRPVVVLASPDAQAASFAARYRCYEWYGVRPGDREARFWGRPLQADTAASALRRFALNRIVFDYRHVAPEDAPRTRGRIAAADADYAYGYSSLLMRLARAMEVAGEPPLPGLKLVVTTAEASTRTEREWLSRIMGGPVADEYGCSESDIIAFTCPAGRRHIMAENVIVETLPVDGQPDLRQVVITDLNNKLMPLLRYRIGDLARISDEACPCGRTLPLLSAVDGRSQNQYLRTPGGGLVHANPFPYFLEERQQAGVPIRQFQVIQHSVEELEVRLVLGDGTEGGFEDLSRRMADMVHVYYGPEMNCRVVRVAEIVPEPGRKFEYFISRLENM